MSSELTKRLFTVEECYRMVDAGIIRPDERLDGPRLDVRSVVRDAVPMVAGSEVPVVAVDGDRVVGVVDRDAVLRAIAGEGGAP